MSDIFESLRTRINQVAVTKRIGRIAELTGEDSTSYWAFSRH